jgi:hypothetical protein
MVAFVRSLLFASPALRRSKIRRHERPDVNPIPTDWHPIAPGADAQARDDPRRLQMKPDPALLKPA